LPRRGCNPDAPVRTQWTRVSSNAIPPHASVSASGGPRRHLRLAQRPCRRPGLDGGAVDTQAFRVIALIAYKFAYFL